MKFKIKNKYAKEVASRLEVNLKKRGYDKKEIANLNGNTGFYNKPIPLEVVIEILNTPPDFQFSSSKIIQYLPGVRFLLKKLIAIVFKINRKLNKNRDIVLLAYFQSLEK